nr:hypothetical protein CFP56_66911 [Quercus suber]
MEEKKAKYRLPIVSRRGVALSLGKRVVSWIRTCNSNSRDPPLTTLREPDLFAAVLWTLWNRRNNLHLGKPTLLLGQGLVGLGVVIRNDHRLIMASLTQQIPLPGSVIEVEVLATRKALELTLELGFDSITLEGDSEILIKSLAKGGNSLAYYGHLLADIHMLMTRFPLLSLSHVRRHCNSLAQALA